MSTVGVADGGASGGDGGRAAVMHSPEPRGECSALLLLDNLVSMVLAGALVVAVFLYCQTLLELMGGARNNQKFAGKNNATVVDDSAAPDLGPIFMSRGSNPYTAYSNAASSSKVPTYAAPTTSFSRKVSVNPFCLVSSQQPAYTLVPAAHRTGLVQKKASTVSLKPASTVGLPLRRQSCSNLSAAAPIVSRPSPGLVKKNSLNIVPLAAGSGSAQGSQTPTVRPAVAKANLTVSSSAAGNAVTDTNSKIVRAVLPVNPPVATKPLASPRTNNSSGSKDNLKSTGQSGPGASNSASEAERNLELYRKRITPTSVKLQRVVNANRTVKSNSSASVVSTTPNSTQPASSGNSTVFHSTNPFASPVRIVPARQPSFFLPARNMSSVNNENIRTAAASGSGSRSQHSTNSTESKPLSFANQNYQQVAASSSQSRNPFFAASGSGSGSGSGSTSSKFTATASGSGSGSSKKSAEATSSSSSTLTSRFPLFAPVPSSASSSLSSSPRSQLSPVPDPVPEPEVEEDIFKLDCVSCMDSYGVELMIQSPNCMHFYCKECLRQMFLLQLNLATGTSFAPVKCCRSTLPPILLEGELTKAQIEKYEKLLLEHDTLDKVYCYFPACGEFISPANIKRGEGKATCPKCKRVTCAFCKKLWHKGVCREDRETTKVLEEGKKKGWQQCPNCKHLVEKTEGCLHITCRCKYEFCYACQAKYSDCLGRCKRS